MPKIFAFGKHFTFDSSYLLVSSFPCFLHSIQLRSCYFLCVQHHCHILQNTNETMITFKKISAAPVSFVVKEGKWLAAHQAKKLKSRPVRGRGSQLGHVNGLYILHDLKCSPQSLQRALKASSFGGTTTNAPRLLSLLNTKRIFDHFCYILCRTWSFVRVHDNPMLTRLINGLVVEMSSKDYRSKRTCGPNVRDTA